MTSKYIILLFLIYYFPMAKADYLTDNEIAATQEFYNYVKNQLLACSFTLDQLKQFMPEDWWNTVDNYKEYKGYTKKEKKVGVKAIYDLMTILKRLEIDFMPEIISRSTVQTKISPSEKE